MNQEKLRELEEFAQLYLTVGEMEILMQKPPGSFSRSLEEGDEIGQAIMRGRLITKAKLRKITKELAIGGSSPALSQMMEYEDQMEIRDS